MLRKKKIRTLRKIFRAEKKLSGKCFYYIKAESSKKKSYEGLTSQFNPELLISSSLFHKSSSQKLCFPGFQWGSYYPIPNQMINLYAQTDVRLILKPWILLKHKRKNIEKWENSHSTGHTLQFKIQISHSSRNKKKNKQNG